MLKIFACIFIYDVAKSAARVILTPYIEQKKMERDFVESIKRQNNR